MKRANAGMKDSSATSIIIGAAQATMPATNIATRRRSPVAASGTLRNISMYAGICRRMRTVQKTEPSRGILERGRSCAARSAEMRSRSGDCSRRLLAARTHATASEIVMPARIRRCNPGRAFDARKVVDEAPEHEWDEGLWLEDGQRRGQRRDRAGRRRSRRNEQAIRKRGAEENE